MSPIVLRMSRRLALLKVTFSGYARPGIEQGPLLRRLLAQRLDARLRSRRFDAVANDLLELDGLRCGQPVRVRPFPPPCDIRSSAASSWSFCSRSRARLMCSSEALCCARSSAILNSGLFGFVLDRLGEVLTAASQSPLRAACIALSVRPVRPRSPETIAAQHENDRQPAFQHNERS